MGGGVQERFRVRRLAFVLVLEKLGSGVLEYCALAKDLLCAGS
jgi:hypothetical protein